MEDTLDIMRDNSETLRKIFENNSNTVTLSLKDYEAIKSVFDENKSLREKNEELNEHLSNVTRVFVKAKIPESTVNKIKENKIDVGCGYLRDVVDPMKCTYAIYIKDDASEEIRL